MLASHCLTSHPDNTLSEPQSKRITKEKTLPALCGQWMRAAFVVVGIITTKCHVSSYVGG